MKDGKSDDEIKKMQYWHSQFSGLPPIDINYRIENILTYDSNFKRTILFYYLDRDYNYLKNIFAYKDLEELVSCIEHSQGKWLIFVHSNSEGNKLYSLLKTRSISSVFISRTSIEKDSNEKEESDEGEESDTKKEQSAKKEYDFIIEHEALNSRVVISTSILDNGINIKNDAIATLQDKILNVAINSFDRIQFIQMLGRIRVNPEDNISLFIQQYSIDELKNQLRKNVELLLHILRNDMLPLSGKQNLFDKQYFRYTESPEIFSEYNPCAIYQLIDNIIFSLNTIRLNEPNFFIDFKNDDMRALKAKIYQYYRVGEGKNKPWSRYVFDILETPDGWVKRTKAESNDTRHSNPLYHALLSLVDIKNEDILKVNESSLNDTIQKFFSKELEINLSNNLSEPLSETLSVQLQWINKTLSDVSPINSENSKCEETITDETLKKYCVSETDIKENKTDESNHLKKDFLEQHGILKDSTLAKKISNLYFEGKPLHKSLSKEIDIDGKNYVLRSFNDNSNKHRTYYIFVCSE